MVRVIVARVPATALGSVALLVASQLSKMGAFLIPLKALLVAGSPTVPRALEGVFGDLDKAQVVAALSAAAIGLYIVHTVLDLLRASLEGRAVLHLQGAQRISLIETAELHLRRAFAQSVTALTALVFSALLSAGIALCVAGLATGVWLYILAVSVLYIFYSEMRSGRSPRFVEGLPSHVGFLSAVGFLGGFFFILQRVLQGGVSSVFVAVVALVLLRLLMNQVNAGVKACFQLERQYAIYKHLLFAKPIAKAGGVRGGVAQLGAARARVEQLGALPPSGAAVASVQGLDSAYKGASCFDLRLEDGARAHAKVYLENQRAASSREGLVLAALPPGHLSVPVLFESQGEALPVRVLHAAEEIGSVGAERRAAQMAFLSALAAFELPEEILRVAKTLPRPIHRRVDLGRIIDAIAPVVGAGAELSWLRCHWGELQALLDDSPRQLVVKSAPDCLAVFAGAVVCRYWENWAVEPVGAVWEGGRVPAGLDALVASAVAARPELDGVPLAQWQLVHGLSQLEQSFERGKYGSCEDILASMAAAGRQLLGAGRSA